MDIENILKLDQKALEIVAQANIEIAAMYKKWDEEKSKIFKSFKENVEKYENDLKNQIKKELEDYKKEIEKEYKNKLSFLNFNEKEQSLKIFENIKENLCQS